MGWEKVFGVRWSTRGVDRSKSQAATTVVDRHTHPRVLSRSDRRAPISVSKYRVMAPAAFASSSNCRWDGRHEATGKEHM